MSIKRDQGTLAPISILIQNLDDIDYSDLKLEEDYKINLPKSFCQNPNKLVRSKGKIKEEDYRKFNLKAKS